MPDQDDVRRIALGLPGSEAEGAMAYRVKGKLFAWPWLERVDPKRARVARLDVLAVRVASELEKQALLAMDPEVFFTEPHYDGWPAILVRLPAIEMDLLEKVMTDARRVQAPRALVKELDA
jgi:hypothetical protein